MLMVPSLICAAWFAIVGAAGIELDETLSGTTSAVIKPDLGEDRGAGFFEFLQY